MKNSVEISNLQGLSKIMNIVNKFSIKELNEYLAKKGYEALQKVSSERINLFDDTNTNQEAKESYLQHNKYMVNEDGFTLYNDMPKIAWRGINGNGYDFSVALAFEFGTGIVGQNSPAELASKFNYKYNVNKYNFGWNYIDLNGVKQHTYGYPGMEIYRYTQIEIEKNIRQWIKDYMKEAL